MSKFAYVTVLYGNNIYLTGAIVLGFTLMKSKTNFDRVILVTPDVSDEYKTFLKKVYTHIININYVDASSEIFSEENTRFRDVFTKLVCLELVQYDKIILLDLDMIISKNIDHLFKLRPPAACLKRFYIPYGKVIPANMICDNNKLVGSINAGLMLLKPDLTEWNHIKKDISSNTQINKFKYPEQDYLSLRYCGKWTSITFNYNFQFGLTNRVKKYRYKIDDIYVIHYSSSYKPWNDLIENRDITLDEKKFKLQHKKYYDLWKTSYLMIKNKFAEEGLLLPY
ncbi:glycosyltransferase [Tupanvirus soda lake]|uniref:Glycosyltransferase n=2 Tax=Tupanvirus TaxID=2094720 RepID=A0A6N1P251_9VIRU|nr:glycosyltransferase [Tupanvirus soda lake]QKU35892.1 glycosyltransferase [Tupanvirus soda lake]